MPADLSAEARRRRKPWRTRAASAGSPDLSSDMSAEALAKAEALVKVEALMGATAVKPWGSTRPYPKVGTWQAPATSHKREV